ncbi:MauE/DoxX family redox-associated membrane protein [Flavobacterium nitrogenifigens]|uniref:Methylamine utilisation protein MauE domain-containing protein n=1 Tax=Flavobacterium nitrogenifigens TaxID=1617283 RepID=A0A521B3Y6_9FLAO|nr:MauE/DoxX family redox-associated membrane protein [Flavobacterium nitrogenifigens]KAF2334585.1 hypothetical protein DM397_07890 [Flavobacterium nitrogenifigens]SMO41827.1 hypothetical protein SAMN06265220_101660 [Flavobacterium nitrogenifigens]
MKVQFNFRSAVIEIISMLYVLLFVYAATSKLLDFQHFKIELGQSPLLSAFAEWVAVLVPAAEYITCLLLIIPRFRLRGLFLSYGLMVMFTVYIFIILHYTSFVPCSCGGVLEKLDWQSHMIFNLVFVCLAILAILLHKDKNLVNIQSLKRRRLVKLFSVITISSISIVAVLFLLSENIVHYHNKLTRRFPQAPILEVISKDLKLNSFYFAGVYNKNVYLGNTTSPLVLTILNSELLQTKKTMIDLDHKELPFRGVSIMVEPPYFFVADGTVPCVFRGKIENWKAKLIHQKGEYFTTARAIDSNAIAVVAANRINGDNVLGVIQLHKNGNTILNPAILQKQADGVFDTDGILVYNKELERIIYLYAYRNQFTIADNHLNIVWKGNTIDTITKAKLHIENDKSHNQRQFSKPPLFVNNNCASYNNLLFVHSAIPGRFEDDRMWKNSSIIDVYDLKKKSYALSFTISNLRGKKMRYMKVINDKMYVLIGSHIILYKLQPKITSHYADQNAKKSIGQIAGD